MNYEWDDNKNLSNMEKHGIAFEEATSVFADLLSIVTEDTRYEYGEIRFVIIGKIYLETVNQNIVPVIVYTKREETTGIISARKASRKERKLYEQPEQF